MSVTATDIPSAAALSRPRTWVTPTTVLSIYVVLLYFINARQVVGFLGAVGTPAMLVGLLAAMLWWSGRLLPTATTDLRPHPVRAVVFAFLCAMVASYAVAMARPLTEIEANGAGRALVTVFALTGVCLLTSDALLDTRSVNKLLRRLVLSGTMVSLLGVVQFATGLDLIPSIPGLTLKHPDGGVLGRSTFNRPIGTALHPIEFSVITAALLPLAIHFWLYGKKLHQRRNYALATVIIAVAVPLSLSRSGLLALIVGLSVLALAWDRRRRLNLLLAGFVGVPILWLTVDGLVGTLASLFMNTGTDLSIQARLDRVPRIMTLIKERPWVGLGNGTYSVEDYFLIDNQIWVTTIETGVIGLAITLAAIATGVFTGLFVKRFPNVDERTGHLAHAIGASIAAAGVSLATFDAFFYHILTGTLFLLIGLAGALWRLHRPPQLLAWIRGTTEVEGEDTWPPAGHSGVPWPDARALPTDHSRPEEASSPSRVRSRTVRRAWTAPASRNAAAISSRDSS